MKNPVKVATVKDRETGASVTLATNERGTVTQRIVEHPDGLGGTRAVTTDDRIARIHARTNDALEAAAAKKLKRG